VQEQYAIHDAGQGSDWLPNSANGSYQVYTCIGDGIVNGIVGAEVGMTFKFIIHVLYGQLRLGSPYSLPIGNTTINLPTAYNLLEVLVQSPSRYLCRLTSY
jgi:hypothetical protein